MTIETILVQPLAALNTMSYETFCALFAATNAEIEKLEVGQAEYNYPFAVGVDQELDNMLEFYEKGFALSQLRIAKQNLTMHRHYATFCDAQDKKHWDAVYHKPFPV